MIGVCRDTYQNRQQTKTCRYDEIDAPVQRSASPYRLSFPTPPLILSSPGP
jgi:hypothetical protein